MSVRVFRSLAEAQGRFGPAALAIGNFDGVHLGHQSLVRAMSNFATAHSLRKGVLTFHPHPTKIVAPDRVPPMLCTLDERIARIEKLGVDEILVLPFTRELSLYSPGQFVKEILVHSLQTKAAFVGYNFHFGHKQAGTPQVLKELGLRYSFETQFLPQFKYHGAPVSSSIIRKALSDHRLLYAARLMNAWFTVAGPVVAGQGIGSKQTVPTLNILPAPDQLLLRGVYITRAFDPALNRSWPSITNVGERPTFEGTGVTIETFLLGELAGPAPEFVRLEFRRFLRDERRFESPDLLRGQILRDVAHANAYWRRVSKL